MGPGAQRWGPLPLPPQAPRLSRASREGWESPGAALTLPDLDEAEEDDQGQRQEFGRGEGILDAGGGLHAVTVDGREQYTVETGAASESRGDAGRGAGGENPSPEVTG